MKYINKQGNVLDALEWDGTEDGIREIEKKFGVVDQFKEEDQHRIGGRRSIFQKGIWRGNIAKIDMAFLDGFDVLQLMLAENFKKHFKPISDARILIVEGLKKDMLLKLRKCQKDGNADNWRKLGLSVLFQRLIIETEELHVELKKIQLGDADADFDDARKECADVANYAAMIHDALNGMELEAMHENKEKLSNRRI